MNYGHFYKLSTGRSDLSHGIAVFDYKGIEEQHKGGKHHLYVTIQEGSIHFAYHYYNESNKAEHLDCDIVTLPLPTNSLGHERLAEAIDECNNVIFPKEIGETVVSHDPLNIGGYSNLKEFNVGKPDSNGYVVRKMLLDFLFDLEHSEVFQVSPLYERVKSALHENPLSTALMAKAEYLFQRSLQIKQKTVLQKSPSAQLIYADDYTKSEERWVEVLNSSTIDKTLAESPWFKKSNGDDSSVSEELNKVYTSRHTSLTVTDFLNNIHVKNESAKLKSIRYRVTQTAKLSAVAYLHRYHLTGIFHIWYGGGAWLATLLTVGTLSIMLYGFIIYANQLTEFGTNIVNFLFPFWILVAIGLLTLPVGKRHRLRPIGILEAVFPRLFAAVVAAWFTIYQHFENYLAGCASEGVNVAMLVLLVIYVYYEIRKKNKYMKFGYILVRTIPLIAIAFIYSFLTGWAMMTVIGCSECSQNAQSRPQMLMFTTIAVFIGIFIQMLFDNNKSITES